GTVITASELLQAFHLSLAGPCGLPQINPTAGPVENTGFGFPPFDVGGIGPGLIPEGPLAPTGFGITTEFVKGVGGGNSTPPGPPGPPTPPPPGEHLIVPDLDTLQYQLGNPNFLGAAPHTGLPVLAPHNVGGTSYTIDVTGNYITDVVASSPAAFITDFWTPGSPPPAFGTHANPGGTLNGQFGTFTIDSAGTYDYTLSTASEHTLSQLGTDLMSQAVNQPFHTYQAGFQDVFDIATSNGFESAGTTPADIKQIQFDFYAANVASTVTAAGEVGISTNPASTTELLLTYTDAVDPAHSFQHLVTVDNAGHVVVTPESGTIVQPNDPALVSLEYLSGSGANVSNVSIEGESFNINATIGPGQHAYSAVINPALDQLGDNGDTGSASAAGASQDSGTNLTTLTSFNDTLLSGISGTFGYLFDGSSTSANGAGRADAVNYADNSDAATLNGSTTAGATSVVEWSSTASIDGNTHIDGAPGSTAVNGGLN
ncbi:MAG: VCBS domain-containing protein, partial [Stellaceae bacterium]